MSASSRARPAARAVPVGGTGSGATARVGEQEEVHTDGRKVWGWYGDGAGRSKLRIDAPGVVVTARNWTTVTALAGMGEGEAS